MTYKMVAIDMDGTLLNENKEVSDRTKDVLLEAQKKGVKIVITTGRIYPSAKLYAQYIGLKTPIIACNGAMIEEVEGKKYFETFPLDKKVIEKAMEVGNDLNVAYFLYGKNKIYTQGDLKDFDFSNFNRSKQTDSSKEAPIIPIKSKEWIRNMKEEILKLTIWNRDEKVVEEVLKKMTMVQDAFVTSSNPRNIELTHIEATKGNALKALGEYYGISRKETIAIGDSYNDQSMIQYAGLGIAMGNAQKDIKAMADYITLSNNADGVAVAIEKFVL